MAIYHSSVHRMKNVAGKVVEKIKTHTLFSIALIPARHAFYEVT
jgi:hypothetical protein